MKKPSRHASFSYSLYELLSSMRFAIGLLTIIAIASVIGTVLKQNEPYPNYAFEFGQFWFVAFDWLGLYDVYHSAWFLTILAFLVISTSLCILRNGPGFIKDMKAFREKATDSSLAAMQHSEEFEAANASPEQLQGYLAAKGFRLRQHRRDDGTLVLAAKKGAANKLGYFFAHIAMVVICLGGLLDGNLPLKLGELFGRVVPETRDLPQSQIPEQSRLSTRNLSFRGNVTVAENKSADVVFINSGNGYLVQELPFIVTLKKFHVDYYSNGMPKLFASDIVVTDKATGKETPATVKVNHPLIVDGVAIYQASFGDGGSPLNFKAWNLASPEMAPAKIEGVSLSSQPLRANGKAYQLEFGEFRQFNIENMERSKAEGAKSLTERMHDAREVKRDKNLKNVGPSITFKLRDEQGQAREYHHYMSPIEQDGASYLIAGMRKTVAEPFQYLRLPLDDDLKIDTFMRLRAALKNPALYDEIARRSTAKAMQGSAISPAMRQQFEESVKWILARFGEGGFSALEQFLDQRVPADKRQAVAQTYIKILQGAVVDVMAVANERAGAKPLTQDGRHYRFLLDSLVAASSLNDYGVPVFLQLDGFTQVQASGLQMTRSPGKTLVYLGSLMLVIGIVLMFYIREVRLWIRLGNGRVRLAMTSNRHNRDLDEDFRRHRDAIQQLVRGA
ncbi:cytochrome c biogenesis protein ResB [Pseudogulbenkiania subflava]|uniref:Cytochrome c biogenesis protein n=1 Tax=Pseudogulbenkiania subflava DSM 22618 TaxID=1123014 RepID=A0A1Y6B876_9NEIS|nr:cytochrome c biogenesis protein ResB [Pseudogulbenkiania subflava]SME93746.1 cytochrome c biogenesis protein [Pseudogulbenkiania subflava DSM 22618]